MCLKFDNILERNRYPWTTGMGTAEEWEKPERQAICPQKITHTFFFYLTSKNQTETSYHLIFCSIPIY